MARLAALQKEFAEKVGSPAPEAQDERSGQPSK
jgi:hypothetical protein